MGDIFISIACYRDSQVIPTVENAYKNAKHKDRIFFGVYAQQADKDLELKFDCPATQVRLLVHPHTNARGPVYARYIIYNRLYKNEEFYLQIDSHTRFVQDWDEQLVCMLRSLRENCVISTYPVGYSLKTDQLMKTDKVNVIKLKKIRNGVPVFYSVPVRLERPEKNLFWAAGFSFCYGAVFKRVPFDPHLKNIFWGEEFLMALRFYTSGIEVYTPNKNIVYTLWDRNYRPTFWELRNIDAKKFDAHGFISFLRLCKIAGFYNSRIAEERVLKDLELYGSGKKRGIDEFLEVSGIKEMTKDVVYLKYVREFVDKI
jgi:[Skp1-protein]-hydroxyproline N-acetylglucosaminyltransferase